MEEKCMTCGNQYIHPLTIHYKNQSYNFDCFECAIAKVAPECDNCHVKIIGHGVSYASKTFCSEHCHRSFNFK